MCLKSQEHLWLCQLPLVNRVQSCIFLWSYLLSMFFFITNYNFSNHHFRPKFTIRMFLVWLYLHRKYLFLLSLISRFLVSCLCIRMIRWLVITVQWHDDFSLPLICCLFRIVPRHWNCHTSLVTSLVLFIPRHGDSSISLIGCLFRVMPRHGNCSLRHIRLLVVSIPWPGGCRRLLCSRVCCVGCGLALTMTRFTNCQHLNAWKPVAKIFNGCCSVNLNEK